MRLDGQKLKFYLWCPWRFPDDKPFQLKYSDGKTVTMDSVDDKSEYEVVYVKTLMYERTIPFNVYEVKKVETGNPK